MNNNIQIREANENDIQAISKLSLEFDAFNCQNRANSELSSLEYLITMTKRDFAQESKFHFVAEIDGKIVAYMLAFKLDELECYYIDEIFVTEKYRSNKIAQRFMEKVVEAARKDKYYVKTEVFEWNTGAIKFYNISGFKNEGFVLEKEV